MVISFVGLVKACLPFSHKHAQANAVTWRRFCELHHYFVGRVPQARTRLPMSNSRVRVGYAATHPTHETRPLRGSPCERGAYSAELQTAPNRPYVVLLTGKFRAATSITRAARERDPTNRMPDLFRCWVYALRANPTYRTARFHWRRFPRAGRIAAGAVKRLRRNRLCHGSGGYGLRPNRPYVVFVDGQISPNIQAKRNAD